MKHFNITKFVSLTNEEKRTNNGGWWWTAPIVWIVDNWEDIKQGYDSYEPQYSNQSEYSK